MKKVFTIIILSLAVFSARADGWGNYDLRYTATTDLTQADKVLLERAMNGTGLGVIDVTFWDEPIKVYTRKDTFPIGQRLPTYQVRLQKIFNNVPIVFEHKLLGNRFLAPEEWQDTGWAIDQEKAETVNMTVEYDNVMVDIEDSTFGDEIPLVCKFYVNNDITQVVNLGFNLQLQEIEWGEWTLFGTAAASSTRNLQTFLSLFVSAIEEPIEGKESFSRKLWSDPVTVDKRVSVNNPNLVQFRLNDIFGGVNIVLDYDTETGTICAERQSTGWRIEVTPGKDFAIAVGVPYTEVKFELPETPFDPKTGEFDLTASKFVISHKMQGAGAFKLAYTEASAINEIEATNDNDTVEYYNLRGQRIKRPENGFYIERRNGRVVKRF